MRLHIIDPALLNNTGHHSNYCRYIAGEARSRGIETRIYAHRDVSQSIQEELRATPLFRAHTYGAHPDPIAGWLTAFFFTKNSNRADLDRIDGIDARDIVYFHGAQPAQLMAAIEWASGFAADRSPMIVVELGGDAGVGIKKDRQGNVELEVPAPRLNGNPTLFRFAAQCMGMVAGRPFHVITYDPVVSATYERLMEREIGVLPFPTPAIPKPRNRAGKRPITIATLGHQQLTKGYELLPEIARGLLKGSEQISLLVHNSDPDFKFCADPAGVLRDAQAQLRAIAANDSRLVLDERAVDFDTWIRLVDGTDLMLCPYSVQRYAGAHSGIASAAVASGIPLVVPEETSLAHWLHEFGDVGTTFSEFRAEAVLEALRRALKSYDTYAERSANAAARWDATHGPRNYFDALMTLNERRTRRDSPAASTEGASDAVALKARGDSLFQQGDYDGARRAYEEALTANPNYGEALANLALVFKNSGDHATAERHLRRASELLVERPSVLSTLGALLHEGGRHDEACEILSRAESGMPESGWIKSNLGSVLLSLGRVPDSIAKLEHATRLLPSQAPIWFNLASARSASGDWDGAIAAYSRAIELVPDYADAQAGLQAARAARGTQP